MSRGKRVCVMACAVACVALPARAIDSVQLTVQPGSTWEITLGVLDRFATDTDTSSVAGMITINLDDATAPTRMTFNGQQTLLTTPDNFDFVVSLGFLGTLESQILGAAGPVISPRDGDSNMDGLVTGADFTIWADQFDNGMGPGGKNFTQGDWSGDGFVTGADFTLWADAFGSLSPTVSGGQYDLGQHLGVINQGTSPYFGTGQLAGLAGTLDFVQDNVPIQAPSGQMGSLTSTATGNPNEYLLTLTIPFNIAATIDTTNGVTLDTVTMITATGLFTDSSSPVPEPGSLVMLGAGLAGLWGCVRRVRRG